MIYKSASCNNSTTVGILIRALSISLSTAAYVCPDIAAKEWQTLFRNHPQLIGLSAELPEPGSYLSREDFGAPILATRDANGNFRAF